MTVLKNLIILFFSLYDMYHHIIIQFKQFVLVDDDGNLLTYGQPTGNLPHIRERQMNYMHVKINDSKYSKNAFERPIEKNIDSNIATDAVKSHEDLHSSDL